MAGARRSSTLALAMEVLEQVARAPHGVTANELARVLGAPRATVYRVVNSLVEDEFLLRRPDLHGCALGARVVELAHLVAEPGPSPSERIMQSLPERSEPFLEYLQDDVRWFGVSLSGWINGLLLPGAEYLRGQRAKLLLLRNVLAHV